MDELELSRHVAAIVALTIAQDIGTGDVTTNWIVSDHQYGKAVITSKANGVFCGGLVLKEVFGQVSREVVVMNEVPEGAVVCPGSRIATVEGPLRALLSAERTALNFVQRSSGIASRVAQFCAAVRGTGVVIVDTRKTMAGSRLLDKYAVRCGGGQNHRMGLDDMVLIKDNHIEAVGGIGEALRRVAERRNSFGKPIKIACEVRTPQELDAAIVGSVDLILLDNMTPSKIASELGRVRDRANGVLFEATGNVELSNVKEYAETGVDRISVGSLTHSASALDISMLVG